MRHNLKELYKYENKIYTLKALSEMLKKDLTQMTYREIHNLGIHSFHRCCNYNTPSKATFEYITTEGVKIAWQFGEIAYFDTEAERDEARAEYLAYREEIAYRKGFIGDAEMEGHINNLKAGTGYRDYLMKVFEEAHALH